jgi:TfoX/Sxy family transcriptional regulator of competence genes
MAFDEGLAERIRAELEGEDGVQEKKMFGGIAFLLHGNMAAGVIKDEMCVRVEPADFDDLLAQPGARIFDFSGRPMKGWLMLDQDALAEDADLRAWIARGVDYASSLPAK